MTARQAPAADPATAPGAQTARTAAGPEALFAEAHRRRRRRRRLAAAAACLVLAGSAAAGLAAAWPGHAAGSAHEQPGPGAAAAPAGTMPPYYVTLAATYPQNAPAAFVRDSATGAVLTAVHLPDLVTNNGSGSPSITGAGDDRTFIITESGSEAVGKATRTSTFTFPPTRRFPHGRTVALRSPAAIVTINRYYLLQVAADGRSASLSRLDIPLSPLARGGFALSPDGSKIAAVLSSCPACRCQYTGIQVITLATGASRTWTAHVRGPFSVSWPGSAQVATQWRPGYRLLYITPAGTNLLVASRAIAGPPPTPTGFTPPALVTPDGGTVITSTVQNIPDGNGRDTVVARIVALSARTGQLLRVLHTATERDVTTEQDITQTNVSELDQSCTVLALAPTGIHALVQCFGFGRVDNGRFTPLPGVPNPNATTVSGSDIWGTGTW